jgi:predicted Rossmann fold nucleotide-binding protein DprA/Smf involved in DNA uptake
MHGGAIVSEYLPYDSYNRSRFVERNRIQAGLSDVVVPVQGEERSGTSHTIRFAIDFHRPLLGVTLRDISERPEDGVLRLLKARGDPVFRLEDPQEFTTTVATLLRLEAEQVNTPGGHFSTVVREFERILDAYQVSPDDVETLHRLLQDIWVKKRRRDADPTRDSRPR